MKYTIHATSTAKNETEDALMYYESVSTGLGLAFLDELENRYSSICNNPFAFGYIDKKELIRDVAVKRFPFVIIYKIEKDRVIVLSVHNTHQNQTSE